MVGYVPTADGIRALRWAAMVAAEGDVPLRIAHAYRVSATFDAAGSYSRGHAAAHRAAELELGDAVTMVRRDHPTLDIELVTGAGRASTLLQRAAEGASMLVVATRHRSRVLQWMGSVTNRVTGRVNCPVVSLPATEER